MATPKQYQEAPPVDGYSDSAFVDAQSAQSSWLAHAEEQEGRHELLFGADSSHAPPPTAPPLQQLEQHEQLSATVEIPQQLDSEDSMQWHYQEPQPQLQQQTQQQQAVHGHAPRYAATASPRGDISPLQAKDYDQDNDSGAEFTTEPEEEETHYTGYDDVDSAYGGDSMIGDDTTSLRSYITDYVYENGRRYHRYRDGAYWGPNDDQAADIIDYAHHIYLITLDQKLYIAPLKDPQDILDVGTGTGIWAIEMAEQFPHATVVGTDLSAIQPLMIPPNCRFEVDDACLEWTYPANSFDYIHVRELFGCIADWDFFFAEAFNCVRPGGWIEVVEHSVEPISDDGSVDEQHFYTEWGKTVMHMGELTGKPFGIWRDSRQKLEKAGFVDIVEVTYKWPMNGWSADHKLHEIGRWNQVRLHHGVEGFMLRLLTAVGGWSTAAAQVFLSQMRSALKDYKTHAYLPGTVVYGRKPLK